MTILEAIEERHSVRSYLQGPIPAEIVEELNREIAACNEEGRLHIQLVTHEENAFDGFMAHYGKFSGVQNYIALIGKGENLDERLGYYGERIAIKAQMLGLNTCWVAMSMRKGVVKSNCQIAPGEKLVCVLSLGYGANQGVAHKSKELSQVCKADAMPEWFGKGMEAALLAPTAMNQQKFLFTLKDGKADAKALAGFYAKVDLGIVKYHFEAAAGKENVNW